MNSSLVRILPSQEVLNALLNRISPGQRVYLVGGVVRDALLSKISHDLDFAVTGDVRQFARRVANDLGGSFYMMNLEHQTARIILSNFNGQPYYLDFTAIRGGDIETDLRARDFSINAMAIEITGDEQIIDPLGGAQDLKDRILRACGQNSFSDDPVRLLRAVRQSLAYQLKIEPNTIQWMKSAAALLPRTSIERQRDEFFRILEGGSSAAAIRILDKFRLLEQIMPETRDMKSIPHSAPHTLDAWDLTLATINSLDVLFGLLLNGYSEEKTNNLILGTAMVNLGRYRNQFIQHFNGMLTPGRTIRGLVLLAALLLGIAKSKVQYIDQEKSTQPYRHDATWTELAENRMRGLLFSNQEIERVQRLVFHHIRVHQLAMNGEQVSRRSIYRYFHDLDSAGLDLCFLSLADTLATYGVTISSTSWERELIVCQRLLDAWFTQNRVIVNPPQLINGCALMHHFNLEPGPLIGKMLAAIQEAQAAGQVNSIEDALELAKLMISQTVDMEERSDDGA